MNDYLKNIEFPPIVPLQRRIAEKKANGETVVNLTQAVIDLMPPFSADFVSEVLIRPETHLYSPDEGIMSLRQTLSDFFNYIWNCDTSYENIIVTPGANNAYFSLLITLLNRGGRLLLPKPYYFNHKMAGEMLGAEIAVCEDNAFIICNNIQKNDIVTLVSPSNPSGRIYSLHELETIMDACRNKDAYLIIDETYALIRYSNQFSAMSLMNTYEKLFIIGSFSKSVPMAGWRMGYAVMNKAFMEDFIKVQDTNVICAPVISQKILEHILPELKANTIRINSTLVRRRDALLNGLEHFGMKPEGACFLFIPVSSDDRTFADSLLDEHNIGVIPGSFFGCEGYIRISYGACKEDELYKSGEIIKALI